MCSSDLGDSGEKSARDDQRVVVAFQHWVSLRLPSGTPARLFPNCLRRLNDGGLQSRRYFVSSFASSLARLILSTVAGCVERMFSRSLRRLDELFASISRKATIPHGL